MRKHSWIISVITMVFVVALANRVTLPNAQGATKGKVLLIVTSGKVQDLALEKEVGVMKSLLQQSGYKVVMASATGQPLTGNSITIKPDMKLSKVKAAEYAGFLLPCLAGTNSEVPGDFVPALKDAIAKGKPVAAQRTGMIALAKTGALQGKKVASLKTETMPESKPLPEEIQKMQSYFNGTTDGGTGIVQDGRIMTSGVCPMIATRTGLPDETPALTKALILQLEKN
jgi:putative intracellular protease/amidase